MMRWTTKTPVRPCCQTLVDRDHEPWCGGRAKAQSQIDTLSADLQGEVGRLRRVAASMNAEPYWAGRTSPAADAAEALAGRLQALIDKHAKLEPQQEGRGEIERLMLENGAAAAEYAQRAERYERALRYIAGEDVAGMEGHQRPKDVALAALNPQEEEGR